MIYLKPRTPTRLAATAFALLLAAAPAFAQSGPQPRLPTVSITAGIHVVKAEVAQSSDQQMAGLMFRREMGSNEGMLFVSDQPGERCFWMKNTLLPLTIAYIADDGTIVNLADMAPQTEASHCSAKPVRFALEMNQGWFRKHGIGAGFKLRSTVFSN